MTDRDRLLEQVVEAEKLASLCGEQVARLIDSAVDYAHLSARLAAHHALTALALRDAVDQVDEFCVWPDAADS